MKRLIRDDRTLLWKLGFYLLANSFIFFSFIHFLFLTLLALLQYTIFFFFIFAFFPFLFSFPHIILAFFLKCAKFYHCRASSILYYPSFFNSICLYLFSTSRTRYPLPILFLVDPSYSRIFYPIIFFLLSRTVIFSSASSPFALIAFSVTRLQHYLWFSSHTLLIHTLLPLLSSPCLTHPPSHSHASPSISFTTFLPPILSLPPLSHATWSYTFVLLFGIASICISFPLSSSRFTSVDRDSRVSRCRRRGWTRTDWWRLSSVARGCKKRGVANRIVVGASIVTVLNERPWQSVSFPATGTRGTRQFYQFISIPAEVWPTRSQRPFCFLNATRPYRQRVPRDRRRGHLLLSEPDVFSRIVLSSRDKKAYWPNNHTIT